MPTQFRDIKIALVMAIAFTFLAFASGAGAAPRSPVCAPPNCVFPAAPTKVTFKPGGKSRRPRGTAKLTIKTKGLPKGSRAAVVGKRGKVELRLRLRAGASAKFPRLRPGAWKFSAAPVVAGGRVFYPAIRVYKAKVKAGAKATLTFDYSSSYMKTLRYADGSALVSLSGPDAGGIYSIEIDDPTHIVKSGTVFVVGVGKNSPKGQMLRIKNAKTRGKRTLATATAADLSDIGKVSFDVSKDLPVPTELSGGAKLRQSKSKRLSLPPNLGASFTCGARYAGSVDGTEVLGNVRFNGPNLHLDASMQHYVNPTFNADIEAGVSTEFQLHISAGVGCTLDQRFGNWILPSIVVPGVPVVLTPTLQLALKGSGEFGAGFDYHASAGVSASAGMTASATGVGVRGNVRETHSVETPTVSGTGSLKVSAGPVVNLYANGYVKFDVSLEAFLKGTWDSATPSPFNLSGGFAAVAGLDVPYIGSIQGKVLVSKEWPLSSSGNPGDPNMELINGGPYDYSNRVALGFDQGSGFTWQSFDTSASHPLVYLDCADFFCVFTTGHFTADPDSGLVFDSQTYVKGFAGWSGPISAGEGGVGPVQCVAAASCYGVTSGGVLKYFNGTSWVQSSSNTSGFGSQTISNLSCAPGICAGSGGSGDLNVYFGPQGEQKLHAGITIYDMSCASAEWCMLTGRKNYDGQPLSGYWTLNSGVLSSFHPAQNLGEYFLHSPLPGRFSCASVVLCYGLSGGKITQWNGEEWLEPGGIGNGYTLTDVFCRNDGSLLCIASNSGGYAYTTAGATWVQTQELPIAADSLLKVSCGGPTFCAGLEGIPHVNVPDDPDEPVPTSIEELVLRQF